MRNSISEYGALEKYIDATTRTSFLEQINETVTWLYGEGQTASNDVYKTKLDAFKKIGLPIKERHRFLSEYPVYLT